MLRIPIPPFGRYQGPENLPMCEYNRNGLKHVKLTVPWYDSISDIIHRFHKMKSNTSETLSALLGTLFFLVILVPIFIIWIPYEILLASKHVFQFNKGTFQYVGLVSIAFGVVVYIWCSSSFVIYAKGTPIPFTPTKKLVVTGLYRFVRNPIYIAGSFVLAGEAILFQSMGIFIYLLIMFGIFHVHVLMEETHLEDKFGETYQQYRKSVPRWIPRLKPYRDNDYESF